VGLHAQGLAHFHDGPAQALQFFAHLLGLLEPQGFFLADGLVLVKKRTLHLVGEIAARQAGS
jgi:hypothetical protein